ncbi:MAG: TIGR01777 family oxidoreductase [Ignavibacteriaceae bacterium]|jgi:conserved hypothetical protein TIGR01777|nr:MAG: nucleoside-diphosphate sugar epimerase [Chlorobi bacterium OLB4]MBW7855765.1 TIGR01777 family protein [Ignavibacteria bacterium]MEB2328965.1 TIGR01777 family oxidoreductase [Ignavibacteriaceae bacterium]OQY76500.1 MAG: TIGR01777 family protein [Ignavibacteriales bacterium UTCHB1]
MNKVSIFGGTGMIGSSLASLFIQNDYRVNIFSRFSDKYNNSELINYSNYGNAETVAKIISGNKAVINLTGNSLGAKRWNESFKNEIYESRIVTTRFIVNAIELAEIKPECFISVSGVGYYGNTENAVTEKSNPGSDFLAKLCNDWEKTALSAERFTRVSVIRLATVLDARKGALPRLLKPFKFFIGGWFGTGKQYFPWIHINDIVSIFKLIVENENITGAVNAASPDTVTNKEFSKTLANIISRPCYFPVPKFALWLRLGEFSNSILSGQKVIPEKLNRHNFRFQFPSLHPALSNLLTQ